MPWSEGAFDALELSVQILKATGQPMLPRQLALKLERHGLCMDSSAVDDMLRAAAVHRPRLLKDDLGRWRYAEED